MIAAGDPRHGTAGGYSNHLCRCNPCRAAWLTLNTAIRARRRATRLPDDDPRHGHDSTYGNHYCRCDRCRTAHRDAGRRRRRAAAYAAWSR